MNHNENVQNIMCNITVEKQSTRQIPEHYTFYVMSGDVSKSTKFDFSVKYSDLYPIIIENIHSRFPYLHSLLLKTFPEKKKYTWPDGLAEELLTGNVDAGKFICFIRDLAHS